MRCPLRIKAFDQPDTCDPDCAWRVDIKMEDCSIRFACAPAVSLLSNYGPEFISIKSEGVDDED